MKLVKKLEATAIKMVRGGKTGSATWYLLILICKNPYRRHGLSFKTKYNNI